MNHLIFYYDVSKKNCSSKDKFLRLKEIGYSIENLTNQIEKLKSCDSMGNYSFTEEEKKWVFMRYFLAQCLIYNLKK